MKPEQITALASECVEGNPKIEDLKIAYKCEYKKAYEYMLRFLLRRYCLVEKSKVEEEYYEAKFTCGNVDPCSETFATSLAQKSMLERLFPEIAKEVES